MKRSTFARFALFMLVLTAPVSRAQEVYSPSSEYDEQARVLVGSMGGSGFGNYFLGLIAGVEIPFAHRYELDLEETFSPIERHVALGSGWANRVSAGGHFWLTKGFGLNGSAEYSNYSVRSASKGGDYAFIGVTWRKIAWGIPARFSLDYIREFKNGISANGTESAHLQGGDFALVARMGCSRSVCSRMVFDYQAGHVLTQSNPICDGTYGKTGGPNGGPCNRTGAWSGGATGSIVVEFPSHRGYEDAAF
jgi:hypothetical protein